MINETLLFWVTLFGFLLADNVITIRHGKDFLSINRHGKPKYVSRKRHQYSQYQLILLNLLALFDRGVIAERITAKENLRFYQRELRDIKRFALRLNFLAYFGYVYLLHLMVNCYLSFTFGFEFVVFNLIVGHVTAWLIALALTCWICKISAIKKSSIAMILFECLLIPAYLINLNKKLLLLKKTNISSLRLHVRQLRTLVSKEKDLYHYELNEQLNLALETENSPDHRQVLQELLRCLRT